MNNRTHIRGRVTSGPESDDELDEPFATFVLENEQLGPYHDGGRTSRLVEWCEVVCMGDLALNVLESLGIGDPVTVWGELRVVRLRPGDEDATVLVSVLADTVGADLAFGIARFVNRKA
jgi:single-stranded DNA-binding protein